MQSSTARLANFVQNLLTYATLKVDRFEMHYEVADMNACIREIAELWSQRFQDKAIAFYFLPEPKVEPFAFDWFKVQHVVSNLLDNAMKYTPASGTVWLHVEPYFWERRAMQRKPLVERRRRRDVAPNCCRVSVADTGPGVPTGDFRRILPVDAARHSYRRLWARPSDRTPASSSCGRKDLGRE